MFILAAVGQRELTWVVWLADLRGKYLHEEQEGLVWNFNLLQHQSRHARIAVAVEQVSL